MDLLSLTPYFISGIWGTLKLFLATLAGCLLLGTLLAAMRVAPVGLLRTISTVYVNVVRNTPVTLVMFFCVFGLPYLDIKFASSATINSFMLACLALTLYTACFVAETLRAGISTIPVGQAEAARALGLNFGQGLGFVILPQAVRTVLPPLGSVIIAMLKNTAIASAFNNSELMSAMRGAIELRGDLVVPILVSTALFYLVLAFAIGQAFSLLEKKVAILR